MTLARLLATTALMAAIAAVVGGAQEPPAGITGRVDPGVAVRAVCAHPEAGCLYAVAWPWGQVFKVTPGRVASGTGPASEKAFHFRDVHRVEALAAAAGKLWVLAGGSLRAFRGNPSPEPLIVRTFARNRRPRGLVAGRGGILTSFPPYREVTRLDAATLEERERIPTPASRICALAEDEHHLYVGDDREDRIYVLRKRDGALARVVIAPAGGLRDIAVVGGRLFCTFRDEPGLIEVRSAPGPHVGPEMRHTVALWVRAANVSSRVADIEMALPIPPTNERQAVLWIRRFGDGKARQVRHDGNVFEVRSTRLEPGETASFCWVAGVSTRKFSLNHAPGDSRPPPAGARPVLHDVASRRYGLQSEVLRGIFDKDVAPATTALGRIHAVNDTICRRLRYRMDGRWSSAARVLEQGHGSCSEYTYASLGLLHLAGLGGRYVGSTFVRNRGRGGVFEDWAGHRWPECHVPPHGWVPFDPTWNDGNPPGRRHLLSISAQHLYLVRQAEGGGPLGWRYRGSVRSLTRGVRVASHRFTTWLPFVDRKATTKIGPWVRSLSGFGRGQPAGVNSDVAGEFMMAMLAGLDAKKRRQTLYSTRAGDAALALFELVKLDGRDGKRRARLVEWIEKQFDREDPYRVAALAAIEDGDSAAAWQLRFYDVRRPLARKGPRRRFR